MSDNNKSSGCGDLFTAIMIGYYIASGILTLILDVDAEHLPAWAHVVSLLFGIPVWLFIEYFFGGILVKILTWFSTILIGIAILVWMARMDLHLWVSLAGVVFLILGGACSRQALTEKSAPWAFNGLGAYVLGLVMIVTGIVTFFIHKGA